jgi:integrase
MSLTDKECRNATPAEKPRKLFDGGGLYLLVHPNGSKYWRVKYRVEGKERQLALGVYPTVGLKEAREKLQVAKAKLSAGVDPQAATRAHKDAEKQAHEQAAADAANAFEIVANEWFECRRHLWTARHAEAVQLSLEQEIFPDLGSISIARIDVPMLLKTLRKLEARGKLEKLARVRQRCGEIFRYGIATGRCERDPAADLKGALKPRGKALHYAALPAAELPTFFARLDKWDGRELTKLAIRLLILTWVRTNELRTAQWSEIDLARAEWNIPAEKMKARRPHWVPFSRQAIAVLERLRELGDGSRYLFPAHDGHGSVMSDNTILMALYRMGYKGKATGHGFRATASTIMNERGERYDVIEAQLAHTEGDATRAAYNRAEYRLERRAMMQRWADYVDSLRHTDASALDSAV